MVAHLEDFVAELGLDGRGDRVLGRPEDGGFNAIVDELLTTALDHPAKVSAARLVGHLADLLRNLGEVFLARGDAGANLGDAVETLLVGGRVGAVLQTDGDAAGQHALTLVPALLVLLVELAELLIVGLKRAAQREHLVDEELLTLLGIVLFFGLLVAGEEVAELLLVLEDDAELLLDGGLDLSVGHLNLLGADMLRDQGVLDSLLHDAPTALVAPALAGRPLLGHLCVALKNLCHFGVELSAGEDDLSVDGGAGRCRSRGARAASRSGAGARTLGRGLGRLLSARHHLQTRRRDDERRDQRTLSKSIPTHVSTLQA